MISSHGSGNRVSEQVLASPTLKVVGWTFVIARFARRKPLGAVGGLLILILILTAIFAPYIAPYKPKDFVADPYEKPHFPALILGADQFGRDILSRVVWGARLSIYVGLTATFLGVTAGLFLGLISGYLGGKLDLIVQRLVDAKQAFPSLVLALALMAALGSSIENVIFAIAITFVPTSSRTIRSTVLGIKENAYIDAARAIGCSSRRVMFVHVLPNTMAPYFVLLSLDLGRAIITEASLSFLGLGVPPDEPSWGGMMSFAASKFITIAPWLAIFPGVAIGAVVYGFNLLGDALRDVLDPRLRRG